MIIRFNIRNQRSGSNRACLALMLVFSVQPISTAFTSFSMHLSWSRSRCPQYGRNFIHDEKSRYPALFVGGVRQEHRFISPMAERNRISPYCYGTHFNQQKNSFSCNNFLYKRTSFELAQLRKVAVLSAIDTIEETNHHEISQVP
jgi:hypothetical protein